MLKPAKNKIEFWGQVLILGSIFIQVFVINNLAYHESSGFESNVGQSLYHIAHGIDQIERDLVEDREKLVQRMNSNGPQTGKEVWEWVGLKGNWRYWIKIMTYITGALFFIGSALVLYEKHFLKKP